MTVIIEPDALVHSGEPWGPPAPGPELDPSLATLAAGVLAIELGPVVAWQSWRPPVAAVRPKVTRWATYYPGAFAGYLKGMRADAAIAFAGFELEGPLRVRLGFTFERPRSHYRSGRNSHLVKASAAAFPRPDGDNLAKGVLDSLSGAAYPDDSAVVELVVRKRYGARAGCLVQIERADIAADPFCCFSVVELRAPEHPDRHIDRVHGDKGSGAE